MKHNIEFFKIGKVTESDTVTIKNGDANLSLNVSELQ